MGVYPAVAFPTGVIPTDVFPPGIFPTGVIPTAPIYLHLPHFLATLPSIRPLMLMLTFISSSPLVITLVLPNLTSVSVRHLPFYSLNLVVISVQYLTLHHHWSCSLDEQCT